MAPEARPAAGIAFREQENGNRSSSAAGRAIVSRALLAVDHVGALAADQEAAWRSNYLLHFRRLVEAGLASPQHWVNIARAGLDELDRQLTVVTTDGEDQPIATLFDHPTGAGLATAQITGSRPPPAELELPYRGQLLKGHQIRQQAESWQAAGILEPSAVTALNAVVDHPEWLRMEGQTVVVLGAAAEMGPLTNLLRWGATVAAVDLPRRDIWQRLLAEAGKGAGRMIFPVAPGSVDTSDPGLVDRAGVDLLTQVGELGEWLLNEKGPIVVGNYAYADGAGHVRVSTAVDQLSQRLLQQRDDVALAFLATPTDVFAVPREAVERSAHLYDHRSSVARMAGGPLRTLTRGRLLQRAYVPGADPGVCDSLVPVQGPNYALAKRIQRWRATVARSSGVDVSFHVAPSTRTRSVMKNRALAAAYAGAHRFGVEIFAPETANTLMAALLVHDLHNDALKHAHPWMDEAFGAVHGGLWRAPYAPRSALGLAAVLGYAAARR